MITENSSHRQVMIKVNVECDEGIAPLVHALNGINGVITLDSCQAQGCGLKSTQDNSDYFI